MRQTVEQLLSQLQASEHDKFAAHLYRSCREYRSACERAGKSGKQIERCIISSFQIAESYGLQGRLWTMGAIVPRESRGSTRAEKTSRNAEPSVDAIYNAYLNRGPGFYRYVKRDSRRRNYYLGRSRSIAAN